VRLIAALRPSAWLICLSLSYNDVKALQQDNLQFRASSAVNINGLYLSCALSLPRLFCGC
jgi:hypothetical protein